MVAGMMDKARALPVILMAAAACWASPGSAKDQPRPSLSVEPVVATSLLAPVSEGAAPVSYRLNPGLDTATGQRAKLSIEVGKTTMFAITGRLQRQKPALGPLDSQAGVLVPKRDGGKVYGAGVSGTLHGVDLSATYQYNKIRTEQGEVDTIAGGPGRSHSLRATARIRFRR